jgi:hypothetical protein
MKKGNILKSDESCISNPKLDDRILDFTSNLRFRISGFEMQDSSDFEISQREH